MMQLLGELQREFGMATILITHDLGVVAGFCEEVLVHYGGQVMEQSPVDPLFADPTHPYTRGLLKAIPRVDHDHDQLASIPGSPPNMTRIQKGCPFAPRCDFEVENCTDYLSPLTEFAPGRSRACNRKVEELT